jgi:acyl-CoA thioester hydrolase
MKDSLCETIRVQVRFCEVDPVRIVWHGHYIRYMEDAREAFGRKYGLGYMFIHDHGYVAPIVDMQLHYKQTAGIDDVLLVEITYRPAKGGKLIFDYVIYRESDRSLILKATTIQLFTTVEGVFEPSSPDFFSEWKKRHETMI